MARATSNCLCLTIIALLAMLVLVALAQADEQFDASPVTAAVLKAKPARWIAVDHLPADQAELVLGDGYTIEIRRGGALQTCRGPLIEATDQWLVLRQAVMQCTVEGIPYLMDIPLVGGLFSRTTAELAAENDVWIPRSTATIVAHLKVEEHAANMPHPADAPPLGAPCHVLVAAGDKTDTISGTLTAIGSAGVTLVSRGGKESQQWQISRQELLSISIVGVSPRLASKAAGAGQSKAEQPSERSKDQD